jgi:hypothetical protein
MPMATRVVTYGGDCQEIPGCYACVKTAFTDKLKLWVKKQPSPNYAHYESLADDDSSIHVGVGEVVHT